MSAGIETRDCQTGIEQAWHGLTKVVPVVTRENCGIVYAMEKQPLFLRNGEQTEYYAIVSKDDGKPIGDAIGKGYQLFSNDAMMEMVEKALAGTKHTIVSVGTINDRAKVFCSVKLSDAIQAGGRKTENVLNVLWGHGGKFGVQARSGFTVVVCQNTFGMAIAERGEFQLRCKHTGNAELKIENMGKAIDAHYGVVAEFKDAMDLFAGKPCDEAKAERIFAGFLMRDINDESKAKDISTRARNQVSRLTELFRGGAGNDGDDMSDVFHAVTDYYSHENSGGEGKEKNMWRQVESSDFGAGFARKSEMFQLLKGATVPKLGDLAMVEKRGDRALVLSN